ncbi:MAG: hypothetical protein ACHBNF_20720 [Chromatiales bacterium]
MPEIFRSRSPGYTWKYKDASVFLPHGTEIRMRYKEVTYYAKVGGDQLVYNGKPISPGALANIVTGSSRNAWRDLWIKRPSNGEWIDIG